MSTEATPTPTVSDVSRISPTRDRGSPFRVTKTRTTASSSGSPRRSISLGSGEQVARSSTSKARRRQASHAEDVPSRRSSGVTLSGVAASAEQPATPARSPRGKEQTPPSPPSPLSRSGRRSKSDPAVPRRYSGKKDPPPRVTSKAADEKVVRLLREGLDLNKERKPRDKDEGENYVFDVKLWNQPDVALIKVGCTGRNPTTRQASIRSKCRIETERRITSIEWPNRHYQKAERLIMAELADQRADFECLCPAQHREYFWATLGQAREVTSRWKSFCEKEPWMANGNLHPFWERRLRHVHQSEGASGEEDEEWEKRSRRWSRFVHARWWDILWYNVKTFCTSLRLQGVVWLIFGLPIVLCRVTSPSTWSLNVHSCVTFGIMAYFTFHDAIFKKFDGPSREHKEAPSERPSTAPKSSKSSISSEAALLGHAVSDLADERYGDWVVDEEEEESVEEDENDEALVGEGGELDLKTTRQTSVTVMVEQDDGSFKEDNM